MMSRHTLLSLFAIAFSAAVDAQTPASSSLEPLASKHFTWPDIPYQVTGDQGGERGPQFGFNQCNSTTENTDSLCQTLFMNNIADFCLWSSSQTDDTIGESEAREVAWCALPGHGTRIIPPGTITGAQWLYSQNYVQMVAFIDQSQLNLDPTDQGGELDPHGADEQGNPLGGIVFTNGFGQNSASFAQLAAGGNFENNQQYTQVIEWVEFIGSGIVCLKMCNPSDPNAPSLCNHIYDEIGCSYNVVADYNDINGTYTVCDSNDMVPPGVYVGADGQTSTWFQPQTGPVVPPYTPIQVSSSNCQTYQSSDLWKAAVTDTAYFTATSTSTQAPTTTPTGGLKTSPTGSGATRTGSGASPSNTSGTTNGALANVRIGVSPLVAAGLLTTLASIMTMFA